MPDRSAAGMAAENVTPTAVLNEACDQFTTLFLSIPIGTSSFGMFLVSNTEQIIMLPTNAYRHAIRARALFETMKENTQPRPKLRINSFFVGSFRKLTT